jgi:hypothetical protein
VANSLDNPKSRKELAVPENMATHPSCGGFAFQAAFR